MQVIKKKDTVGDSTDMQQEIRQETQQVTHCLSQQEDLQNVKQKNKGTVMPILITLLVMLLWGSLFPMVKIGYETYDIVSIADIMLFAGVRFTICGIAITIYAWFVNKASFPAVKGHVGMVLAAGLFAIILHYIFTYTGLLLGESGKTAIIKQIGPLFYICLSFLFFKNDKFTIHKFIGGILGFVGIIAINFTGEGIYFSVADWCILAASLCSVFSSVISKKLYVFVNSTTATGLSQLFGGVVLLLGGIVLGGTMSVNSVASLGVLAYLCLASSFGYCLWAYVLKSGELSKMFVIKFAEPIFAAVFSAVLIGEDIFNIRYLAAFVLICAGIIIANKQVVKLNETKTKENWKR